MPESPADLLDAHGRLVWTITRARRLLRVPDRADDKRSRGTVAVRTGSEAYPGAAVLGVEAAWRAGAGYVQYCGPRRPADLVLARRPETVVVDAVHDPSNAHADAWVIGSGTDPVQRSAEETTVLRRLLDGAAPVVVDAGALDLLPAGAAVIATPHEGEFTRLRAGLALAALGSAELRDPVRRAAAVIETAEALDGTVLLKGSTTLVAEPGAAQAIAVAAGTGWLAAAGTGDVLAGVIGALVAADRAAGGRTSLAELAATAAWLHGRAGRIAAGVGPDRPGHPLAALDVAEALPAAFARVLAEEREPGDIEDHTEEDDA